MRTPRNITFTGVDEQTDPHHLREIAAAYPVEFGILVGDKTSPRFPNLTKLPTFHENINFSCHFCGSYSRKILNEEFLQASEVIFKSGIRFKRVQVNSRDTYNLQTLKKFADALDVQVIWQTRDENFDPAINALYFNVVSLFDKSGGRGKSPAMWPTTKTGFMGFAGGIGPHNVREVLETIQHPGAFWIDMETHVRDENDRFDLNKVLEVCRIVYP